MEADDRTLFIGNIDKNVTEEILYELFLQAGPIERVSIPNSRNEASRYGFITYKHECSIDYALELYKGTNLFKKELSIKKRCPKNTSLQLNDFNKFNASNSDLNSERQGVFQLHNLAQKLNHNSQSLINFTSNSLRANRQNQNRPYDFGMKYNFSRQRDVRDRWKDRNYGNKPYHGRKTRHRD